MQEEEEEEEEKRWCGGVRPVASGTEVAGWHNKGHPGQGRERRERMGVRGVSVF